MPQAKATLKHLETLKRAGYHIPKELIQTFVKQGYAEEGLVQVWKCKPCGALQKSEIEVKEVICTCRQPMKLHWSK